MQKAGRPGSSGGSWDSKRRRIGLSEFTGMDISEAERLIEASPDHRLLRRVPPPSRWALIPAASETRRAVFVDVETTGLDQDSDEVIELALVPFEYERDSGRIVGVEESKMLSALRQPSRPIPPDS